MTTPLELDTSELLAPDGYAMRVIRYQAAWLVNHKGVPAQEQPDVVQELALRLLKRLENYDPARSKITTFVANSVRYDALALLQQRFTKKRIHERATRSLDTPVVRQDGPRRTVGDFMTRPQQVRGRGRTEQDDQNQIDLREDVLTVLESLPPDLRRTCEAMLDARTSAEARRKASSSELKVLRQRFSEAALRNYL